VRLPRETTERGFQLRHTNQSHPSLRSTFTLYPPDERATVNALAATLRIRDTETQGHSERVVRFSSLLGREFGLNPAQMKSLEYGSLLHDIGKIGIPDAILHKPGPLTTEEWTRMREHPLLGLKVLSGVGFLEKAALVVVQHHERWDGKGYPFGLAGTEIDRNARIFAVADAFDAMISDRVYRAGRSFAEATEDLTRRAGQQFDPEVVECFTGIPQAEWELARQCRPERAIYRHEYSFSH
jgi:HD-GYP domain-containing protein (c-di-GMP phosphodiesterase class II)